jgi:zinc resistance-associated protein
MKKVLTVMVAMALAASLSLPALAADGPKGSGMDKAQGYHSKFTPEQRAEFKKVKAEYLNETMALRQQLAAKKVELKTVLAQPSPDAAKIKAVADEKVDLQAQLMKKRNEYLAKYPKYFAHHKRHHGAKRHMDQDRPMMKKAMPPAGQAG